MFHKEIDAKTLEKCLHPFDAKTFQLILNNQNITDHDLKIICSFIKARPQITHLSIGDNSITHEGALLIAELTLSYLDISGNKIGNQGLAALTLMTSLSTLVAKEISLSGNEFSFNFSDLTTLNSLNLAGNKLEHNVTYAISSLTALETLNLTNCRLDATSIKYFSTLTNLRELER